MATRKTIVSTYRCLAALVAGIGFIACSSDAPTKPAPGSTASTLGIRIYGGDARGFIGEPLASAVTVQVVDSALKPVQGNRRIRFSVAQGGGSISDTVVLTTATGLASVTWVLGGLAGVQQIAASLADAPSSAEQRFSVQAYSPDAADRIVIGGATSGTIGILIRTDNNLVPYTLVWPDTVLRLLPRAVESNSEEVTAFTIGHPPVSVVRPWTSGVDTIQLAFRSPIAVPFTVWVAYDFDTTAARARHDLNALDATWQSHMTGLRVGNVRIQSAPGLLFLCGGDTRGYFDGATINVYYMDYRDGDEACSASIIRMNVTNPLSFADAYQFLLAHEVGHTLSLDHLVNARNIMMPQPPPGEGITTGQIYWMHFDSWGALNSVLGIHPAAERHCQAPLTNCPVQTFTAW